MNPRVSFQQVITSLEKNNQAYVTVTLQNEVNLIIPQRGARILGPFLSPDSESIFWLNPAFAQPDSYKQFLNSADWNIGGERVWIAPEIQYLVRDRADFWGTIRVPEAMDPGHYTLDQTSLNECRMTQRLTLPAYNLASGEKELQLERRISPAADPLRSLNNYEALVDGLIFAGYEHLIALSESKHDEIMSESWNLVQLNPGGQLLIPASPQVEYSDYYEPITPEFQSIHPNHVSLRITGDRQYKVGYKAAHVFGRLGYFNQLDDNRAYLIVRNFFNNPAAPYVEERAAWPGRRGHSVHIYNDDGALGGFGELECNGQAIGGVTARSSSADPFVLWLYVGAVDKVKQLIPHLLGIEL
jgi:hypothetical protein